LGIVVGTELAQHHVAAMQMVSPRRATTLAAIRLHVSQSVEPTWISR
jgi:hypothetical protein